MFSPLFQLGTLKVIAPEVGTRVGSKVLPGYLDAVGGLPVRILVMDKKNDYKNLIAKNPNNVLTLNHETYGKLSLSPIILS